MDKKDQIILQQMEVIRSMTEKNLRSMGDDFWGSPLVPSAEKGPATTGGILDIPEKGASQQPPTAANTGTA